MIIMEDVTKTYSTGVAALNGINLHIQKGEFVFIVGKSGSGKSTLIKLLLKELDPTSGKIYVNKKYLNKITRKKLPYLRRDIGVVFQDFRLLKDRNIYENIAFAQRVTETSTRIIKKKVPAALSLVGLAQKYKAFPKELSGGMKQRVAIAKALALKPQIILMDEPFASLDAMTRNHLQEELMKLHQKEKVTVIFITHNIQEAVCLGTRILVMAKQGGIKMDVPNTIPKPVTPASEGYGQMWDMFNKALHQEG